VLLANVLVMVNTPVPLASDRALNVDRLRKPGIWPKSIKDCKVLELGCGVGLTGLVAASLGAKLTLLTDLNVVVERVTEQNVVLNKKAFGIGQAVFAVPLCWGSREDENICRNILGEYASKNTAVRKGKKSKKKNLSKSTQGVASTESMLAVPDIILIGDVAYQHKPGAPSHFDILIETLLNFASNRDTLVIFGTRMRMPASSDLLDMFYEHFDEVVKPPVEASELDNGFHEKNLGKNSMITLHFFKRKQAGH
jgi:predicted nicotinamide N-methyase